MNKVVGMSLLVLAGATVVGMVIKSDTYWLNYNYITIILSVIFGISLLRRK